MLVNRFASNKLFYLAGIVILTLIFALSFGLAFSSLLIVHPELAIGVTYDLTLTAPLIYLLLIWKTKIPKTTVVPVFVIGVILASFLVPAENQFHLSLIKRWVLPLVEIGLVGFIGFSVYKTVKTYRKIKDRDSDFLVILQKTCLDAFGNPLLANALAFEIAVLYYGFLSWKGFKTNKTTFSYHKKIGKIVLYSAIIFIIGLETAVVHVLISRWNNIAAWVLTISSVYIIIQIYGHLKAVLQRPIEILGNKLFVRFGLFSGTEIEISNIEFIESATNRPAEMTGVKQVSLLGDFEQINTKIQLKSEAEYFGAYGIKERYKTLLLFVDEPEEFREAINLNDVNDA